MSIEIHSIKNVVDFLENVTFVQVLIPFSIALLLFCLFLKFFDYLLSPYDFKCIDNLNEDKKVDLEEENVEFDKYEGPIDMVVLDTKIEKNIDYDYELLELKCNNCGALLDEKIINNGKCKCNYCGTSYLLNRKKF